jgi:hypothetical protein
MPKVGELTLPRWQYWLALYNEGLGERERAGAGMAAGSTGESERERLSASGEAAISGRATGCCEAIEQKDEREGGAERTRRARWITRL